MTALLVLLADEAASAAAAQPAGRPWYELLLDNAFGIMLIMVFLTAIIGTFVGQRNRDRCLKKFNRFAVTIIEQGGRAIWGTLKVFSNGIEVLFSSPFSDDRRVVKQSFLYYQSELAKLLTITRYLDEITIPRQQRRRRRQIRKMARPGLLTRTGRRLRNFVNTFRDAIAKSFGMAIAQAQKTSRSTVIKTGAGDITSMGTTLIGQAGNAYEPMLEQYFGREVVAEIVNPADPAKGVVEVSGYLGEYSAAHLLLVNCTQTIAEEITIPEDHHLLLAQQLEAGRQGTTVTVYHRGTYPVTVTGVAWGETARPLDVDVPPGGSATFELDAEPPPGERLHVRLRATRTFDVVIPRTIAVVRHKAEFAEAAG